MHYISSWPQVWHTKWLSQALLIHLCTNLHRGPGILFSCNPGSRVLAQHFRAFCQKLGFAAVKPTADMQTRRLIVDSTRGSREFLWFQEQNRCCHYEDVVKHLLIGFRLCCCDVIVMFCIAALHFYSKALAILSRENRSFSTYLLGFQRHFEVCDLCSLSDVVETITAILPV